MGATIAVVGATGHVGGALAERLLDRGVKLRVIGRSAERLRRFAQRGAEVAAGSVEDPDFVARAFAGADAAFAMLPPNLASPAPRARARAIGEALAAGIERAGLGHVVMLSSIGADLAEGNGPIGGLHDVEQRLNRTPGASILCLRPGYFYENFLAAIPLIRDAGINGGGHRPDTLLPSIATRDIAAVAADLLETLSWSGREVLELRGPRDYTPAEATAILGAAIGRPGLPYVQFSYQDFAGALVGAGISPACAEEIAEMAQAFNEGLIRSLAPRSRLASTTTTLEEWARAVFAPAFGA